MISLTFFCALKHCSELSKSCSRLLLLKIRTGLNPGNEARPINPFPSFIFWLSFHFSRCQNRSFFAPKSKRKRLLRRLFQMFRCSRKFSAGTTRPKKPCFILIYRRKNRSYACTLPVQRKEINVVKVRFTMRYSSRKLRNDKVITTACNF